MRVRRKTSESWEVEGGPDDLNSVSKHFALRSLKKFLDWEPRWWEHL